MADLALQIEFAVFVWDRIPKEMYRFSKVSKSGKYSTLFYSTSFSEQICKILENWLELLVLIDPFTNV